MREKTKRKVGAKRMWIRRWLQTGRISAAEARAFEKHLERTGALLKPKVPAPSSANSARQISYSHAALYSKAAVAPVLPTGSVVTIQYDPSRFRIEFTAIRRGRRPKAKSGRG